MILIAHRGNISGPNPEMENRPEYVKKAIDLGYNVEVDVWYENNQLFLGHDGPQYKIKDDFLCLLYTSPSPRDATLSRMPSSA